MASPFLSAPLQIGDLTLKNRIALAPLTRARAGPSRLANDLMVEYYSQRSGGGLLITEATAISSQGYGWANAPGCYTEEQAESWRKVVDAVHAKGSLIFLQLWHMGRQSHSSYHNGQLPVSASAIAIEAGQATTATGEKVPYETPRALETSEIAQVVEDYGRCAAFAKSAGFDGVEIHGANGYLIDQFLQTVSNQRTDEYGGSFENRYRLLNEVIESIKSVYPANRIAVRLSPNGAYGGMGSEDNAEFFPWVAKQLSSHGLAFLHVMDGLGFGFHNKCRAVNLYEMKKNFDGYVMGNVGFEAGTAEGAVRTGAVDLIAFGRHYISNPDLAERIINGWPLAPSAEYADWWTKKDADGYTTFPAYSKPEENAAAEEKTN